MYTVLVRLIDGDLIAITQHEDLQEAVNLADELNAHWQWRYFVSDAGGKMVYSPPKANHE